MNRDELNDAYENDPLVRALVDEHFGGGWRDDDGVAHAGPTIAGVKRAIAVAATARRVVAAGCVPSDELTPDSTIALLLERFHAVFIQAEQCEPDDESAYEVTIDAYAWGTDGEPIDHLDNIGASSLAFALEMARAAVTPDERNEP